MFSRLATVSAVCRNAATVRGPTTTTVAATASLSHLQQRSFHSIHTFNLNKQLDAETLEVINATAPVVAENLDAIVKTFYPRMFRNNPEVLAYFNMSNQRAGRQPHALAQSVLDAVGHLNNLADIKHGLLTIGHKHCALGVLPEHYGIVHDNFLGAVAEVLGDAVTPEIANAWSKVLLHVAGACIDVESQIYEASAARPGNWDGKDAKKFVIAKVVEETPTVRSIYIRPFGGGPSPSYTPGQYVSLHVPLPEGDTTLIAPRHYTISSPIHIDGCLRISVRRMRDESIDHSHPDGQMSTWIHNASVGDTINVRPPFGIYTREYLNPPGASQEVYFTAGIGISTAAAMMPLAKAAGCRVGHIHTGRSIERHAFRDELGRMSPDYKYYHYDGGDASKFLDMEKAIRQLGEAGITANSDCRHFVCGPPSFMETVISGLRTAGVTDDHIHHEFFGPAVKL